MLSALQVRIQITSHLEQDCCGFTAATDSCPVHCIAAFCVLGVWVTAEDDQQAHEIMIAFVSSPVQWTPPVIVKRVEVAIPPQHQMVKSCCVAVLSCDVAWLQHQPGCQQIWCVGVLIDACKRQESDVTLVTVTHMQHNASSTW